MALTLYDMQIIKKELHFDEKYTTKYFRMNKYFNTF